MPTRATVVLSFAMILPGLPGCAALPPPPHDPQLTHIGIAVKVRGPAGLWNKTPDIVLFAKLDAAQQNLFSQTPLIPSSFVQGNRFYLLNATPGRYIAVAASWKAPVQRQSGSVVMATGQTNDYVIFFPEPVVQLSDVTVPAGAIQFMGDYLLDWSLSFGEADQVQLFYVQMLAPGAESKSLLSDVATYLMTGRMDIYYRGSMQEGKRDAQAEERFLLSAMDDLQGGTWKEVIEHRIEVLKSAR